MARTNASKRRWVLLVALVVAAAGLLASVALRKVTVADILSYTPKNYLLATGVIWALYGVKSLSVFFPLMVLYLSVGLIFPPAVAVGVNLVGLVICVTLPFAIGRLLGENLLQKLESQYEVSSKMPNLVAGNGVFLSFLLRVIGVLPGDVVSLFLGAGGTPYLPYLAGSLLGLLPVMLPATLLGDSAQDPLSPRFLIPFVALAGVSLLSVLGYRHWSMVRGEKQPYENQ